MDVGMRKGVSAALGGYSSVPYENVRSSLKRVCVFCGAYSGARDIYKDATIELGKELVKRGCNLIYGGANVGLMGTISNVVHDGGQKVMGIIPKSLVTIVKKEGGTEPVGEVIEVEDMHQRKAEMERLADAFIALPGGFGTWEELLEQITWVQLGIHRKPVGVLNVNGYYDSLLAFLDGAVQEGFMAPSCRSIIVVAANAHDLMTMLEDRVAHRPRPAPINCASAVVCSENGRPGKRLQCPIRFSK
ncbi:hypothetical protein KP509_35G020400 [Ceratopteris richardii]|uniref:Cytokinin riboside 5'-monophosphate phosphoribohydrolase n=1 Tax=Ceratopteris richardii TaxID=49495 RepID=A0A8T2QF44_CERRI|nr:hypothetical protein KP509_35G020400 [Ceratopteris richardii]